MLEENINFKYYRMIPKGYREYVRRESSDSFYHRSGGKKSRQSWSGTLLKSPHLYIRGKKRFESLLLCEVPPDPCGGMTECTIELRDNEANLSVVYMARIKCSNKDNFSYKIGREMALEAARRLSGGGAYISAC